MARIALIQDDITRLQVDAIVNAANSTLLGGGGVDGAIHEAAGPELLAFCRSLGGCPTGEVRLTPGFNLPANWVIHTVGPVWHGGDSNEPVLLRRCYRNALRLAREKQFESVAFPAISTGVYGYPKELATRIALDEMRRASELTSIIACCYSVADLELYRAISSESDSQNR